MAAAPPTGPIQNLPIGDTAGWAYRLVFTQFPAFLAAAAVPFLLLASAQALSFAMPESGFSFLLLPVFLGAYCLFSVSWLRYVLLGPEEGRIAAMPRWRGYHWRFLGASLLLTLIMLLMQIAFMSVVSVASAAAPGILAAAIMIAGPLLMLVVYLRLHFILPAAAVEEPYSLGLSWAHTRGQSLRLLAVFLAVLPIFIPMVLSQLASLNGLELPETGSEPADPQVVWEQLLKNRKPSLLNDLLFSALQFLGTGVLLTMIARAFTALTGWVPGKRV